MKRALVLILTAWLVSLPAQTQASPDGRDWLVSYNAALDMHEAAVPTNVYPVGTRLLITFHGRQVVVHAIYGGCQCFDISDEAFNRLSDTSWGVIRAHVARVKS